MKFSIIIPTKNRQYTAIHAIKSCVLSSYQNIEIIISDVSDNDSLRNIITNLDDSRVKYFYHPEGLSMKDNWEFGVSKTTGDYVSIIGDDDALMPDGLLFASELLKIDSPPLLSCITPTYKWPDYPLLNRKNFIGLKLPTTVIQQKQPINELIKAYEFKENSGTGPGIYHGLASKDFLETLKSKRGAYFMDEVPDFDSGFCTMLYAKYYLSTTYPIFVAGQCGASNSGSMNTRSKHSKAVSTFATEASTNLDSLIVSDLRKLVNNTAILVSAMIRFLPEVNKVLSGDKIKLNKQNMFNLIAKSVGTGYEDTTFKVEVDFLKSIAKKWKVSPKQIPAYRQPVVGLIKDKGCSKEAITADSHVSELIIDGDKLGIRDIQGAIKIIESATTDWEILLNFLGLKKFIEPHNRLPRAGALKNVMKKINNNETDEAITLLENNIKANFADAGSLLHLGVIYFNQERFHEAILPLARSLSFEFNTKAFDAYFNSLININQVDFARQVVDNYTEELNYADSDLLSHCLGIIEMKSGNYQYAAEIFYKLKPSADKSLYYYCAAYAKFLKGEALDADKLVKEALHYNSKNPEYLSLQAEIEAHS